MPTRESRALVEHSLELARTLGIGKLLIQADGVAGSVPLDELRESERVLWLRTGESALPGRKRGDRVIDIPEHQLTRISQLKLGLFIALARGFVSPDESVLCLSGGHGAGSLDTLVIMNPKRDFAWLPLADMAVGDAPLEVLQRVIEIAVRFAAEGREGKPIGTALVVADPTEIAKHTRQLVLNPLHGHARRLRSIKGPQFLESLRELSGLDGCIVVDRQGVAESAGTYLDAPLRGRRMRRGLGARHHAAAALTSCTDSVVVTISESSGAVRVFYEGEIVLEIERGEYLVRSR